MQEFTAPIPLSLYIHLPWCVRKCPYCDFNSHEATQGTFPEERYVEALLLDLDEQLPALRGRHLTSIFFGGGTPSLFSPHAIEKILRGIHHRLSIGSHLEITLEANPGTVDEKNFLGFRQAGINRLSLGIQSFQDEKLKALGRIHNREYALRAIQSAKQVGFDRFNLDLMHGLPHQSVEDALSDLKDALAFEPTHLSWYQLTIEPNTFFHHQPPSLPEESILWDIQEQGAQLLFDAGLTHYEVSAYSKLNNECAHNLNYWEFGDYLGIGAGAHSKITDMERGIISRHWQMKNPKDYLDLNKPFVASQSILSEHDVIFEFMLNALRLIKGVPMTLVKERTGLPLSQIETLLREAKQKKLLIDDPHLLCPSAQGHRFLNDLIGMFLLKNL